MRKSRPNFVLALCAFFAAIGVAGAALAAPEEVAIWPARAPGSETWKLPESMVMSGKNEDVRNISRPTLLVHLPPPDKANGMAVIIAPGSRMTGLALAREGTVVAEALNRRGYAAFVLKHRLIPSGTTQEEFTARINSVVDNKSPTYLLDGGYKPEYRYIIAMGAADMSQAIRYVRQNVAKYGVKPDKVGVIGFTSGTLLVNSVIAANDAATRPDFAADIHGFTIDHAKIPANAPPLFIACAHDDDSVSSTACADLYLGWHKAGAKAEMHIFSQGTHMFNMIPSGGPSDHWIDRYIEWLDTMKPAN